MVLLGRMFEMSLTLEVAGSDGLMEAIPSTDFLIITGAVDGFLPVIFCSLSINE